MNLDKLIDDFGWIGIAGMEFLGLVVFVFGMCYLLFPNMRKDIKEDWKRKAKW